jgi:hypothetical protein
MTSLEFDVFMRRIVYLTMFVLAAGRVIATFGHDNAADVILVWSILAMIAEPPVQRIPRARVVVRRQPLRVRMDALLIRIGEAPVVGPGHLMTHAGIAAVYSDSLRPRPRTPSLGELDGRRTGS